MRAAARVSITGAMVKVNSGGGGDSASSKSLNKSENARKLQEQPKFKKKVADDLGKKPEERGRTGIDK